MKLYYDTGRRAVIASTRRAFPWLGVLLAMAAGVLAAAGLVIFALWNGWLAP